MRIAKLSLICLIAFAFMIGCGMMGKKAEMSESTTTAAMEGTATEAEMKGDTVEAVEETAVEEITLNVTGMT